MRRDLSTIDRNIGQMWSRIIQEAFKHGIDCDIIHGGLLLGKSEQGIHEASTVQNYILGTRRITPDGRVFRYGKCGTTLTETKVGVFNGNHLVTTVAEIVSAAAEGATSLTVTFAGDFWAKGTLAKDELLGGYISIYNSSLARDQRMIISNTALGAAGECTIGIDEGISVGFTSDVNCEVLANPYANLGAPGQGYSSVMGMPAIAAEEGDYFWIQTWGPLRISPTGGVLVPDTDTRLFVFASNGGIHSVFASDELGRSEQIAGFIIENTQNVNAAPFIMLQISP